MVGRRLGIALLVALPLMAVITGPSGAGLIAGIPVNDPDFDNGKGDGTNDTQIQPQLFLLGTQGRFHGIRSTLRCAAKGGNRVHDQRGRELHR